MAQENSGNGARASQPILPGPAEEPLIDIQKLFLMGPHFQAGLLRATLTRQNEALSFLGKRYQEDLKLAERIGSASSISDMISACVGFCQEAAQDYAEQAGKVTDIGSDLALVAVANLKEEAESGVEAMRAEAA